MAKRPKSKSQYQSRQKREFAKHKANVRELKRLGLYKGDLRKPITSHAVKQVRRFKDVLTGKAVAVKTPTTKRTREYRETFRTKYRKVVIPVRPNERVFYDRKTGTILSYRREYERNIKRIIPPRAITAETVAALPAGLNIKYVIPIGAPGHVERFNTFEELAAFMQTYEVPHMVADKHGVRISQFKRWQQYVELEIVENGDDDETDDESDY